MTTEEDCTDSVSHLNRRKKKKSFLQKAKKFGKRGRFGKGREIDSETYNYFVRVWESLNANDFPEESDRSIFIENVFEQTRNAEIDLSCNQLGSRVVERLLNETDSFPVLERFMNVLAEDLRIVSTDPFASHVLEKLILLNAFVDKKVTDDDLNFRRTWIIRVSKFAVNNFELFAEDAYASHILKTCFQSLAGILLPPEFLKSKASLENGVKIKNSIVESSIKPVDRDSGDEILTSAVNKLVQFENLKDRLYENDAFGSVLQSLIYVLNKINSPACETLVKFVLETVFNEENSDLFESVSLCKTLETMIYVTGLTMPKLFKKIYKRFFKDKLIEMAQDQVKNFAVQKLISSCPEKEMFEAWYESEFDANIEKVLVSGNFGVIWALAQTCNRLGTKQAHFSVALMKSLHIYEPSALQIKIVPLLSVMASKETYDSSDLPISRYGSLIIQELLKFNKPIKTVTSLLSMEGSVLRKLLSDPKGSHITDVFMTSSTIGEKSRDALIKALQNDLSSLACSKHGSRTIDALWKESSSKSQDLMASELSKHIAILKSNPFGKFVFSNLNLETFKRNYKDWKTGISSQERKRKMFEDIIKPSSFDTSKKQKSFFIDVDGAKDNFESVEKEEKNLMPPEKKAKKVAKSYLDDL